MSEVETRRLAESLAAQFLSPPGTRVRLREGRRAIRAVVAGLDVADACHDDLGDALVAEILRLLRGVADGTIDRVSCRITAQTLLRHVVHAVEIDRVVPLVRMLGALALLPDGDDRMTQALSPVPAPGQRIEEAIASHLAGDDESAAGVRHAILAATVVVPVLDLGTEEGRITIRLLPLIGRDGPMVSVFSTAARFEEYRHAAQIGTLPSIELAGWELPLLCPPGHGVMVNPGSVLGCALSLTDET